MDYETAMLPIANALGFKPGQTVDEGWANVSELLSDSERGIERRQALDAAVALQNYQFNCHGVELGQIYRSAAVVSGNSVQDPYLRDPELYYHPTTYPGASIPHAWLEYERARISTLDLCGHGRFTLLTGIGGDAWRTAAESLRAELGIDLVVWQIGPGCEVLDTYGTWKALRKTDESGCILVRPDRHVAWRAQRSTANGVDDLRAALMSILSRQQISSSEVARKAA